MTLMMWMELQLQLKTIPKWRLNCFRSDLFFISSTHFSFLFLCPLHLSSISPNAISFARCDASKNRTQNTNLSSAFFRTIEHYWRAEDFPYCFFFSLSSRWNNQQWKSEWPCHIQCDIRGGESSHWVSRTTAGGAGYRARQDWGQNR